MKKNIESIKATLKEGNARYIEGETSHLKTGKGLRKRLTEEGQSPEVVVFTCSDSRVNPEAIFSAGLGEIFVIRSAGHALLDGEMCSIAYAVEHLHSPYVLVLGHTHCGAVDSALSGHVDGSLAPLLSYVCRGIGIAKDPRLAERNNVSYTVSLLKEKMPETVIEGAVYDILSGKVEWLG